MTSKRSIITRPKIHMDAFLTSLVRYGDADAIVRIFTREKGRLSGFCKRAYKPSKSRGGNLQVPSLAHIGIIEKPNADMVNLVGIDLNPTTYRLTTRMKSFGYFSYLCEITEVFVPEREPVEDVFDLLASAFQVIGEGEVDGHLLRAYELKLLSACGYLPDLGGGLDSDFHPPKILESDWSALVEKEIISFEAAAKLAAINLLESPLGASEKFDLSVLRMVGKIFVANLRMVKKSPLKSVAFLKSLGV